MTIITEIIKTLQSDTWYNVSENIDSVKGKYKIPSTWKGLRNYFKRMRKYGN